MSPNNLGDFAAVEKNCEIKSRITLVVLNTHEPHRQPYVLLESVFYADFIFKSHEDKGHLISVTKI
jgi:hypothetical protein